MVPSEYGEAVRKITWHLENTQLNAIEQAADLVAAALRNKGCVYCSGIGHGNEGDFLGRAGGLAAVQRFSCEIRAEAPKPDALKERDGELSASEGEKIRMALKAARLRAGDVMLLSSVSGRNSGPIELALACGEVGIKTIGLTSMVYTRQVTSAHPSEKKLYEVVDVAIDNGAPFGDAAVEIAGYDFALLPVSGVAMTIAGWMLWGRVMEMMAETGEKPTVFMSANRPGGPECYQTAIRRFAEKGY